MAMETFVPQEYCGSCVEEVVDWSGTGVLKPASRPGSRPGIFVDTNNNGSHDRGEGVYPAYNLSTISDPNNKTNPPAPYTDHSVYKNYTDGGREDPYYDQVDPVYIYRLNGSEYYFTNLSVTKEKHAS